MVTHIVYKKNNTSIPILAIRYSNN